MDRQRTRLVWAMVGYGMAGFTIAYLAGRFLPAPLDIAVMVATVIAFAVWRQKVAIREVRSGSPSDGQDGLPSPPVEASRGRPPRPLRIRTRSTTRFRR
ncbi:hypothetical protein ABZ569_33415 [Streptomyces albus]|uniref:hypothetical protein n=1 Tax=Streptomyces albus TaxID=1888 RepID=UPI0033F537B0